MSKQQLFDKALNGIRAQGGPSRTTEGFCAYRGTASNRKCAAGHLITDENYIHNLEGQVSVRDDVTAALIASGVDREDLAFVRELQLAHDNASFDLRITSRVTDAGFFPRFEENMATLAHRHGLAYAA